MKLIDHRTPDGSRHFSQLRGLAHWQIVCDHVLRLPGAEINNSVRHELAGARLRFTFRGHRFTIRSQQRDLHLIVDDPQCSDLILFEVGLHFEQLAAE
ncbi:MAG: hypothetical protein ABFC96_02770 [Thermoguttaceae bacterium]